MQIEGEVDAFVLTLTSVSAHWPPPQRRVGLLRQTCAKPAKRGEQVGWVYDSTVLDIYRGHATEISIAHLPAGSRPRDSTTTPQATADSLMADR